MSMATIIRDVGSLSLADQVSFGLALLEFPMRVFPSGTVTTAAVDTLEQAYDLLRDREDDPTSTWYVDLLHFDGPNLFLAAEENVPGDHHVELTLFHDTFVAIGYAVLDPEDVDQTINAFVGAYYVYLIEYAEDKGLAEQDLLDLKAWLSGAATSVSGVAGPPGLTLACTERSHVIAALSSSNLDL